MLTVLKATGPTVQMSTLCSSTAAGPLGILENSDGNTYWFTRENINHATGGYSSAFHVLSVSGTAPSLYIDGTVNVAVTQTPTPFPNDFDVIGCSPTNPAFSDGDIAEIIFYNVALSSIDRANIEKYLGTKYGIAVAGGTAVDPSTVAGLVGWWKSDSLG
jgi:hypothetical protein